IEAVHNACRQIANQIAQDFFGIHLIMDGTLFAFAVLFVDRYRCTAYLMGDNRGARCVPVEAYVSRCRTAPDLASGRVDPNTPEGVGHAVGVVEMPFTVSARTLRVQDGGDAHVLDFIVDRDANEPATSGVSCAHHEATFHACHHPTVHVCCTHDLLFHSASHSEEGRRK